MAGYRIGSFNLRDFNFSNKSSDGEEINRDFGLIADIILGEKFDLVAVQEINSEQAIKYLTSILNTKSMRWEYDFSGKAATAICDPEGYGFIWNVYRLELMKIEGKNNPAYYNCAGGKDILRPPYYGRFSPRNLPGGLNFEIRIINVHIRDATREEERIKEFDILVKQVLPRICDHRTKDTNMPAYTFLAGDYNLRLDKGERALIRIDEITRTNYTGKYRNYRTVQDRKTSLKQVREQQEVEECYASNYDHFTYESKLDDSLGLTASRVEAVSTYCLNEKNAVEKLQAYRQKVSDHVPIELEINLR